MLPFMAIELNLEEENIMQRIHLIRRMKVMLDSDLALLNQVETKQLKRQVKRNIERFPSDFFFELSPEEWDILRYQFGTSSWGGTRFLPMAFKEHLLTFLRQVKGMLREFNVLSRIMSVFDFAQTSKFDFAQTSKFDFAPSIKGKQVGQTSKLERMPFGVKPFFK